MFSYKLSNKELTVKYQDMVLKIILELPLNSTGCIYQPKHFEQNFPFLSSVENLKIILRILCEKGLLDIQFSDISDDCFIDTIFITAKGYDYFPMKFYIQTSETILNELQKKYTLDNLDINIIETYLKLEPAQRRAIKEYISKLADSISENKTDSSVSHKNVVSIRTHKTLYYDMPVSAGTGNPLEDEYPEEIELMEKPPKGTDFIVRVAGNSMEPTYYNNNRLFVKEQPEVENGEIGIFVINGNAYVKEFGGDKLISHNEAFPDIAFNEYNAIKCCGKVLGICKENF